MSDEPTNDEKTHRRRLSRREFLPRAAGAVVGAGAAGVAGYNIVTRDSGPAAPATATATSPSQPLMDQPGAGYHSFVTRPDLRPPVITVSGDLPAALAEGLPRFIALSTGNVVPNATGLQSGPMLVDRLGRIAWFQPMTQVSNDLQVQSYRGKPVITWCHGPQPAADQPAGTVMILDGSYRTVATVSGVGGYGLGNHDFVISSRDTGLVTSYKATESDLSSQGGPPHGRVLAGHLLEIDIATGKLISAWNSLDHVPVSDSYQPFTKNQKGPYDYFHLNSVAEMPDGDLLLSGRHTSTVYRIDRASGRVRWQMGGKRSDFHIPPDARFAWQHHARPHGPGVMTLFDNATSLDTASSQSRGLMLSYDTRGKRVRLIREFLHPARLNAWSQGSVQVLPNGTVFVGWGAQPYYSTYRSDGTMVTDSEIPIHNHSYRAFLVDWVGHPTDSPAIVAQASPSGGFAVYASWNGATEIDTWTVMAGKDRSSLQPVATQRWSGLETTIVANSQGPFFQVVAHDRHGGELGRSEVV